MQRTKQDKATEKFNRAILARLKKMHTLCSKGNIKSMSETATKVMKGTYGYLSLNRLNIVKKNNDGKWIWAEKSPTIDLADKVRITSKEMSRAYLKTKKHTSSHVNAVTVVGKAKDAAEPQTATQNMDSLVGATNQLVHNAQEIIKAAHNSMINMQELKHDVQMLKAAMFDLMHTNDANYAELADKLNVILKKKE